MEEVTYYQGEQVIEQYANRADDGLTPEEQTVVSKHFTDPDARILDLGCGTGRTTAPLDAMGYDIVGVDLSEALVGEARKSHPEVSFQVGDATDLSFPDESFDYALFTDRGIDDIPTKAERMRAILEVWRVLRPGGVFAFDVNNQLSRFVFDPRSLEAWGDSSGSSLGTSGRARSPRGTRRSSFSTTSTSCTRSPLGPAPPAPGRGIRGDRGGEATVDQSSRTPGYKTVLRLQKAHRVPIAFSVVRWFTASLTDEILEMATVREIAGSSPDTSVPTLERRDYRRARGRFIK